MLAKMLPTFIHIVHIVRTICTKTGNNLANNNHYKIPFLIIEIVSNYGSIFLFYKTICFALIYSM